MVVVAACFSCCRCAHGGGVRVGGIRWYLVHLLCMAAAAADVVESCSRTFYLVCMWFVVVVGCVCVLSCGPSSWSAAVVDDDSSLWCA